MNEGREGMWLIGRRGGRGAWKKVDDWNEGMDEENGRRWMFGKRRSGILIRERFSGKLSMGVKGWSERLRD